MPKKEIQKGDIVGRKSYGKDVIFIVKNIFETKKGKIAILRGITERVEADCEITDLELIDKKEIKLKLQKFEEKINKRIENKKSEEYYKIGVLTKNKRAREKIVTGKILHLDGDALLQKCNYMSTNIL